MLTIRFREAARHSVRPSLLPGPMPTLPAIPNEEEGSLSAARSTKWPHAVASLALRCCSFLPSSCVE